MRIRMLGPVRVRNGGRWVPVTAERQRLVLAVLLVDAGRAVSTERLVDAVWAERPPRGAVNTVQAYVMRLRRLLGDGVVATRERAYELLVGPNDVDAVVFERLVAAGRRDLSDGRPEQAAARLDRALALWRGDVFADVPANEWLITRVAQLEQLRLAAEEDHAGALLAIDRHEDIVDELYRLVDESPLREQRWELLMRALHRCGRRADALEAFRRARKVLVDELGIEPGPQLREVQRAVLADDEVPAAAQPQVTRPAQLPGDVRGFTGRVNHLARLDAMLPQTGEVTASAVVISALEGSAGVGKTALAVHWGHRVRDHFDGGQLYVNLRGYADGPPLRPIDALARFLRALGVPNEKVPSDVDEASAMYRSLLAGQRVLVLLDNASEPDQVRPLLPGSGDCLALVTSRDRLGGLVACDGAVPMPLDVLTPDESCALLARLLGTTRVGNEPAAVGELAALCGHLPLALRIAAANLAARPYTSIADYAARLRRDPMGGLQAGADGVRAAFDLSYTAQPDGARRLFRLLGLVPGADLTVAAAAALADLDTAHAERLLDRLVAAHLVDEHVAGRYTMHDLIRSYAAERAVADEPESQRRAAVDRLYRHYQRYVDTAASLLYPHAVRLPAHTGEPADLGSSEAALAWLDSERANLVSAVCDGAGSGMAAHAYRLADALRGYLHRRMHLLEWLTIAQAGLAAAEAEDDTQAMAAVRMSLAVFNAARGQYPQALREGRAALALAERADWTWGQSAALNVLGTAHAELGRLDEAADLYGQALVLDRGDRRTVDQATRLGNLGNIELMRGRLNAAIGHYMEALTLNRENGSLGGEALTLDQLGLAHHALGQLDAALLYLTDARASFAELGERQRQVVATRALAAVHRDAGRCDEALELAESALAAARETGDRKTQADTLLTRASIHSARGDFAPAIEDYRNATDIALEIGHRYIHTETLIGQASAYHGAGQPAAAAGAAHGALTAARQGGYRLLQGKALAMLADIYLAEGECDAAFDAANEALEIYAATEHEVGQARARSLAEEAHRRRTESAL